MVGTEEAPLDVVLPEADVEDLAVGLRVGVVAVGAAAAVEGQVVRHRGQEGGERRREQQEEQEEDDGR